MPRTFITDLRAAGIELAAQGENLLVTPVSHLTDEQREFIKANKSEILRLLRNERRHLDGSLEARLSRIRAWLQHIGESDDDIAEVLGLCRTDPEALDYYLKRSDELAPSLIPTVRCADCTHRQPTDHPALVACAAGVQGIGVLGLWWVTDPHPCNHFKSEKPE